MSTIVIRQEANGSPEGQSLHTWVGALACAGLCCVALSCIAAPSSPRRSFAGNIETAAGGEAEHLQKLFLRSGGRDPVACRTAARALIDAGEPEEALEVLALGLESAPGDANLLETQGNALARAGFRRAAERSFEDSLRAAPDRVSALRSLGRVRLALNRSSAALVPLERCIELRASDTDTYLLLAQALMCTGRQQEAFENFAAAFSGRDVSATDLVTAAKLILDGCGSLGRRPTLEAWLERALQLDPKNAQAHYYLGVVHADGKDYTAALQSWRRAVALDPGHVPGLEALADCHRRRGNVELAARFTRRAEKAALYSRR